MRSQGGLILGGVGIFFLLACAGKTFNEVGELNAGAGGDDTSTEAGGSGGGATASRAGTGAGPGPSAGTGGVANPPNVGETAGAGGATEVEPDVGTGTVFEEGLSEVTAVTANETTLYWVEHGNEDDLGNYLGDGRLLARDFDSEEARVLASELPGPVGVALSSDHVFVFVDQLADMGGDKALLRVPRVGGSPEVIMLGAGPYSGGGGGCPGCFVHRGDTGYFPVGDKIYRILPEAAEAEVFAEMVGYRLAATEDKLYVQSDGGVWSIDYETALPANITPKEAYDEIQVSGDFLYALDEHESDQLYLARMPLGGGAWTRLPPKRVAKYAWRLQIVNDLFFHDLHTDAGWQLIQGSLSAPESAEVALALREQRPRRVWIGTQAGAFWNDGNRVIHVPLAVH
jgi:hypothetical protein